MCLVFSRGDNFRKAFGSLKEITALFDVPLMVFTATATSETHKYILEKLEMKDPIVVEINPDRPNIKYNKVKRETVSNQYKDFEQILDKLLSDLIEQRDTVPVTTKVHQFGFHLFCVYLFGAQTKGSGIQWRTY